MSFRVAPATLVFEVAIDLGLRRSAESVTSGVALRVLRLHRRPALAEALASTHRDYRVEGVDVDLRLTAAGYRQVFRSAPVASRQQSLSTAQRGLPSFSTAPFA